MTTTEIKRLLPSGAERQPSGTWRWERNGGHPDKTLNAFRVRRDKAGFVSVDSTSGGCPDGSVVNSGTWYANPAGDRLYVCRSYGATAADNWFRAEFFPAVVDSPCTATTKAVS